jgi:hypothetical protein
VQLDDAHCAAQLVERLKWAGEDAEQAEHERPAACPRMNQARAPSFVDPGLDRPVGSPLAVMT